MWWQQVFESRAQGLCLVPVRAATINVAFGTDVMPAAAAAAMPHSGVCLTSCFLR